MMTIKLGINPELLNKLIEVLHTYRNANQRKQKQQLETLILKLIKQIFSKSKVDRMLKFITKHTPFYSEVKEVIATIQEDVFIGLIDLINSGNNLNEADIKQIFYQALNTHADPFSTKAKSFRRTFRSNLVFNDAIAIHKYVQYQDLNYYNHCKDMINYLYKNNKTILKSIEKDELIDIAERLSKDSSRAKDLFEYLLTQFVKVPNLLTLAGKVINHFYANQTERTRLVNRTRLAHRFVLILLSLGKVTTISHYYLTSNLINQVIWAMKYIENNPSTFKFPELYKQRKPYTFKPKPDRKSLSPINNNININKKRKRKKIKGKSKRKSFGGI